jgi:cell division protein FtsI/penicillin-binding protein 2
MTLRRLKLPLAIAVVCAAAAVLLVWRRVADAQRRRAPMAAATAHASSGPAPEPVASVVARVIRPLPIENVVEGLDPSRARRDHDRYVVDLPHERRAVLTLDPEIQRGVSELVASYGLPRAAVVVLDTDTGRVRAYVSRGEPGSGDLARDATAPAASVFKVVTASALVQRGVAEDTPTCFSGGFHAVLARDLVADAHRDRDCISLAEAFGRSANTVFARRAVERMQPPDLLAAAHAWGFGEPVPFDAPVSVGQVDVPTEPLEFARAAAGFWHSHLSALHGAVIAEAIARGGVMQRPYVVDGVFDAQGVQLAAGAPHEWRRAVPPEVATSLAHMMAHSVSEGTARTSFHDPHGRPYLPGVDVGGKTGTLTGDTPFRAYTWFIGNASSAQAHVSFAVMVVNGPVWRVRAPTLARQVLQIVYRGRATQ